MCTVMCTLDQRVAKSAARSTSFAKMSGRPLTLTRTPTMTQVVPQPGQHLQVLKRYVNTNIALLAGADAVASAAIANANALAVAESTGKKTPAGNNKLGKGTVPAGSVTKVYAHCDSRVPAAIVMSSSTACSPEITVTARDIPRLIALLKRSAEAPISAQTKGGRSWALEVSAVAVQHLTILSDAAVANKHAIKAAGGIEALEKIVSRHKSHHQPKSTSVDSEALGLVSDALKLRQQLRSVSLEVPIAASRSVVSANGGSGYDAQSVGGYNEGPETKADNDFKAEGSANEHPTNGMRKTVATTVETISLPIFARVGSAYDAVPALLGLCGDCPDAEADLGKVLERESERARHDPPPSEQDEGELRYQTLSPRCTRPPTPSSPRPISPNSRSMAENSMAENSVGESLAGGVHSEPVSKRRRVGSQLVR